MLQATFFYGIICNIFALRIRKLICISSIIQQFRQLDLFDVYQFGIAVNNYGSPHLLVKLLDTLLCTYTECLKYVVLLDNVAKLPLDVFLFEDLNTKLDDCSTAARSFPSRCLCAVLPLMVFEEAKNVFKTIVKACTVVNYS